MYRGWLDGVLKINLIVNNRVIVGRRRACVCRVENPENSRWDGRTACCVRSASFVEFGQTLRANEHVERKYKTTIKRTKQIGPCSQIGNRFWLLVRISAGCLFSVELLLLFYTCLIRSLIFIWTGKYLRYFSGTNKP